jgi:MFS family permease
MTPVEEIPVPPPTRLPAFLHSRVGGLPRAFWALWAGSFVNRLGTMVEPFLAFYLTGVRGLSVAATGIVLALFGLGAIVSQIVGGVLADRVGRRVTLTGGMLATAAAMLALGYATATPVLVVLVFVLGLTIDAYRPASQALLADLVGPAERARAFGLLFWAINLGFAVAMVLGGTLSRAGFSWLFWADAATCAVFGVLVWRAVPETAAGALNANPAGSSTCSGTASPSARCWSCSATGSSTCRPTPRSRSRCGTRGFPRRRTASRWRSTVSGSSSSSR